MPPSKGNSQKQDLNAAKKARAKQQAKPPAKPKPKPKAKGPSAAVQALLNDPAAFTAPQTYGQAIAEGGRVADHTYGPQIAQVQLQQRQSPAWFDQYRASLQTPQQVQTAYAPSIQAVNANATETAQATPGIDPNSEAGKTDALAAKAREALVHLGASTLTANQQADTTYYQGRQGVADAAQIGANTQLSSQLGSLQGQRGAAVAQYVGQARQQERDYGLAQQHQQAENKVFGVKQQTAVQARKDKQNEVITSGPFAGYTKQQVRDLSPEKKQKLRTKAKTPSSVVTGGAFAGYTQAEIRRMPQAQKDQLIAAFRKGKGKKPNGKDRFGNTREQRRSANNAWNGGLDFLRANKTLITSPNAITAVKGEAQVPYDIAKIVVYWARNNGKVTPAMARKLRRLGVKVSAGHIESGSAPNGPGSSSGGGGGPQGTGTTTYNG